MTPIQPRTSETSKNSRKPAPDRERRGGAFYACLSLIWFACAMLPVGLLLWKAELLTALGLTGQFYYIALLPLALMVTVFLFGTLRSLARYRGKQFGGVLELGGPVVGFLLVIILGFVLPPQSANFPLTVYVHGEAGIHELILKNSGYVLLDIGGDRRREAIGDKGQAFFPEIPASFRGQMVHIALDAEGFELVNPDQKKLLDRAGVYLAVQRKPGRITGRVLDEGGRSIVNAKIEAGGVVTFTTENGRFDFSIPGTRMGSEFSLQAEADGFAPWRGFAIPNANEMTVIMHKQF